MTSGIEHPHVIDVIAHDEARRVVTLAMIEGRDWTDSDLQLFQLQEKFNAYLAFALDGELAEAYPQLADHQIKLRLDCPEPPEGRTLQLLTMVREQIAFRGIDLEVVVTGGPSTNQSCSCQKEGDPSVIPSAVEESRGAPGNCHSC